MALTLYTTEAAIQGVLAGGNDYRRGKDLRPYMRAASVVITNYLTALSDLDLAVPDDEVIKEIAAWVGAWAYKNSDQQYANDSKGRSSASFKGQTGMGLDSNHYGQAAKVFDPHGVLGTVVSGRTIGAAWLGRPPSEQTDYVDRN